MKHYSSTQLLLIMPRTYLTLSSPHYLHTRLCIQAAPPPIPVCLFVFACFVCVLPDHNILPLVECCFTSTETVDVLGTGAQNGHLDLHTAPEVWTTPFSVFFSHSRSISVHTSRVIIKCDSTKNKFRFRIQPHERLAMDMPAKMDDSSV